jgi:hypothetical protein
MFKKVLVKIKSIKISNLLFDRFVRLSYTILGLFLGANFFIDKDFFLLQQITLFQSFLLFLISAPVNSILIRIGNSSIFHLKGLLKEIFFIRLILGTISIFFFSIYLFISNFSFFNVLIIVFGLIPTFLSTVFIIEFLPHILNFEGKSNWKLVYLYLLFFIIKCSSMILFKSLELKIFIEIIEILFVLFWNYYNYLSDFLFDRVNLFSKFQFKTILLSSGGMYLNGILSVFILRIDQFALINLVDKKTLSSYMLIVSMISLFLTPLSLLSERLAYVMSIEKSKSLMDFSRLSVKTIFMFIFLSFILYFSFLISFIPISQFFFKRDLTEFLILAIILGTSIISNSLGMVFGQINSILNGGLFTMQRSLFGCILLLVGVSVGFNFFGIIGVSFASALTLFITNILFWFLSPKLRRVIFYK